MNATTAAMMKIGQYEPKNLPSGFTPTLHFIHRITRTLNDIRYHIIGFRNVSTVASIIFKSLDFFGDYCGIIIVYAGSVFVDFVGYPYI